MGYLTKGLLIVVAAALFSWRVLSGVEAAAATARVAFDDGSIVVPPNIVEGAMREGEVRIRGTMEPPEWAEYVKPFQQRVPFVRASFTRADGAARWGRVVMEHRAGKVIADVVTGLSGGIPQMVQYGMLEDLRDLPTFAVYDQKDPQGRWIATFITSWGIGYRTDRASKKELRSWEDLVNAKWGKRLAIGDKPNLTPHVMWALWGPEKTKNWLTRLFAVKPQLRKEGAGMLVKLLAAGEYDIIFPVHDREVRSAARAGAPVAWTFPEGPYFAADPSDTGIIKGSPNLNAAKLFLTYMTSKEGQLLEHKITGTVPAHRELTNDARFLPWPEEQLGRKVVTPLVLERMQALKETTEFWKKLMLGG